MDIGCSVEYIAQLFYNQPRGLVAGVDIEEVALSVIQKRLGSEWTFRALQVYEYAWECWVVRERQAITPKTDPRRRSVMCI